VRVFSSMETSASGLTAQRLRLDVIASNLANAESTRTENGQPYRRKVAVFSPRTQERFDFRNLLFSQRRSAEVPSYPLGVKVTGVVEDSSPLRRVYSPGHPDAYSDGYVNYPNVNVVTEMVDMMAATRSYEANVTAIEAAKAMIQKALDMFRA
jgi:flagellar basal-body rod protein FlgC